MAKLYDLAVKTGTYQKDGETKNRYQNIGAIIEGNHGPYMLLERTFNPAGVAGQDDRSSVIISLFKVKGDRAEPYENPVAPPANNDFDDVPF